MYLIDVNVLVYAHKTGSNRHEEFKSWLVDIANFPSPFGLSEVVLSGFVRVVTHPRIFDRPSSLDEAFGFANALRDRPNAVSMRAGDRHWELFENASRAGRVKGSLVSDAYHAALAIETGSTWVTTDSDFARFPGLDWRHPLD